MHNRDDSSSLYLLDTISRPSIYPLNFLGCLQYTVRSSAALENRFFVLDLKRGLRPTTIAPQNFILICFFRILCLASDKSNRLKTHFFRAFHRNPHRWIAIFRTIVISREVVLWENVSLRNVSSEIVIREYFTLSQINDAGLSSSKSFISFLFLEIYFKHLHRNFILQLNEITEKYELKQLYNKMEIFKI